MRAQFRGPGWSRVVGRAEKKDGENAEVFLRLEKDGKIGGLGVVVAEPKEVTIVSIVGVDRSRTTRRTQREVRHPQNRARKKKKTGKDD